jgi:hypothetical protein
VIIPGGNDLIKLGDFVVVATMNRNMQDLGDILK